MRQPIKQLNKFRDLSSVKCGAEVVHLKSTSLTTAITFKTMIFYFSLSPSSVTASEPQEQNGAARNPRRKKRAKSWGQESREIADFFRVTIDEVTERGTTRSLTIKIAVVSRESYSSPGL